VIAGVQPGEVVPCPPVEGAPRRPPRPPMSSLQCTQPSLSPVGCAQMDLKRIFIFSCWGGFGFTPIAYKWCAAPPPQRPRAAHGALAARAGPAGCSTCGRACPRGRGGRASERVATPCLKVQPDRGDCPCHGAWPCLLEDGHGPGDVLHLIPPRSLLHTSDLRTGGALTVSGTSSDPLPASDHVLHIFDPHCRRRPGCGCAPLAMLHPTPPPRCLVAHTARSHVYLNVFDECSLTVCIPCQASTSPSPRVSARQGQRSSPWLSCEFPCRKQPEGAHARTHTHTHLSACQRTQPHTGSKMVSAR
jgi:hypothetical protein